MEIKGLIEKERGTVVNQDYRSPFIESRTDDVMKLRMT